jgi:hypothetical protein
MKRVMCFRFRGPLSPAECELNFYFFELTYKYEDGVEREVSQHALNYYMARDTDGVWKIVPETSQLPPWVYKYETRFGEAIDASLGIETTHLELWAK